MEINLNNNLLNENSRKRKFVKMKSPNENFTKIMFNNKTRLATEYKTITHLA